MIALSDQIKDVLVDIAVCERLLTDYSEIKRRLFEEADAKTEDILRALEGRVTFRFTAPQAKYVTNVLEAESMSVLLEKLATIRETCPSYVYTHFNPPPFRITDIKEYVHGMWNFQVIDLKTDESLKIAKVIGMSEQ